MSADESTLRRFEPVLAATLIVGCLVFHAATVRGGHEWGGDFALYLTHARNLVEGRPYAESGYVFNPGFARIGPPSYPPGTPALLTLPVALRGLDIEAAKRAMLVPFALFLAAFYLGARRRIGPEAALLLLPFVGLNPFFRDLLGYVLSDIPFLATLFVCFFIWDTGQERPDRSLRWACYAGLAAYACYATRALGLVVLPAFFVHDWLRHRRLRPEPWLACAVALPLLAGQNVLLATVEGYQDAVGGHLLDDFPFGLVRNLAHNAVAFPATLASTWRGGLPLPVEQLGAIAVFAVAGLGAVASWLRRPVLWDVFGPLYALAFALFPFGGARRLTPLLPVVLVWAVAALLWNPLARKPALAHAVGVAVFGFLALSYGTSLARADYGPLPEGVHTAEARELFAWVRREVPEDDVVIFAKPRPLALFTDRHAAAPHEFGEPDELRAFFDEIGARWVIVSASQPESAPLDRYVAAEGAALTPVYSNGVFTVLRRTR